MPTSTALPLTLEDPSTLHAQILPILTLLPILPPSTASSLLALYSPSPSPSPSWPSFLYVFWDAVSTFARQIPNTHPAQDTLRDVCRLLKASPHPLIRTDTEDGEAAFPLFSKSHYQFDTSFRGLFDGNDDYAADEAEKTQRALNLRAYGARLMGAAVVDLDMFAVWDVVTALEEVYDDEQRGYHVAVAAEWLTHAGRVLYGRTEDVAGANQTRGPLWSLDGRRTLCEERWRFWKSQFQEIADGDRDGTTRAVARHAKRAMDVIEEEHSNEYTTNST